VGYFTTFITGALISKRNTLLERNQVLNWFGNRAEFERYLFGNQILADLDQFEIEFEFE